MRIEIRLSLFYASQFINKLYYSVTTVMCVLCALPVLYHAAMHMHAMHGLR
jgi:hypothetical protein